MYAGRISTWPIVNIVESHSLKVNPKKTRLNHYAHRSHRVTGISFHIERGGIFKNARTTLSSKKQNFYRARIWKAICILRSGRQPCINEDGFSLNQINSYIRWTRHICGARIPSKLKKVIEIYENHNLLFSIRYKD